MAKHDGIVVDAEILPIEPSVITWNVGSSAQVKLNTEDGRIIIETPGRIDEGFWNLMGAAVYSAQAYRHQIQQDRNPQS